MKRIVLFATIFIISISSLIAQEQFVEEPFFEEEKEMTNLFDNAVGARYSSISGFGLAYTRYFSKQFALKFTALIHYDEKVRWKDMSKTEITRDEKDILYDIGLEFQVDLISTSRTKIYALIGGYTANETNKSLYDGLLNSELSDKKIVAGIGCGILFHFSPNVAADISAGFIFGHSDIIENGVPGYNRQTVPGYGVGLSFLF